MPSIASGALWEPAAGSGWTVTAELSMDRAETVKPRALWEQWGWGQAEPLWMSVLGHNKPRL